MGKNYIFDFQHVDHNDISLSFSENYKLLFNQGGFNQLSFPSELSQEKIKEYIEKIITIFSLQGRIFDERLDVESFFLSLGVFFLKNKQNICSIYEQMECDSDFCLANVLEKNISQDEKLNIGNYLKILRRDRQLCQSMVDDMCALVDFDICISSETDDYLDYL